MGGAALGMMCVVLVIALPIGLCIASLILMGGVALANKCIPQPRRRSSYDDDDEYEWEAPRKRRRGSGGSAIPMPAFGHAMLISFVTWIVNFGIGFVLGLVAGAGGLARNEGGMLALQGCSGIIGLAVAATVISSMLPTSFPRACLVVLFMVLIWIGIFVVLILPLGLVAGGFRALR